MKILSLLFLIITCTLYASAYKVPTTSLNGVALSGANIAHSTSADAAYYNPANMAFMKDSNHVELDIIYLDPDSTNFQGSLDGTNIESENETFFIPSLNYVSPEIFGTRLGLSILIPAQLTDRWLTPPAIKTAKEFSLKTIEINPTVAIPIGDLLGIAFGLRVVSSSTTFKSSAIVSRDIACESVDYGYNLAVAYKPTKQFDIALTYRSKIDLTQEGSAKLYTASDLTYYGGVSVDMLLPASINLALAYTLKSQTTIEFVYERNFWSAYKTLDFNYKGNIGKLEPYFGSPVSKNYKDTNILHLGLTQDFDKLTLMGGVMFDETPIPSQTVDFELSDSDSLSLSIGARYQVTKNINFGISALYSMKEEQSIVNENINGKFSNSNILIISGGIEYRF